MIGTEKIETIKNKYNEISSNPALSKFQSTENSQYLNEGNIREKAILVNFCDLNDEIIRIIEGLPKNKEEFSSKLFDEKIDSFPSLNNIFNGYLDKFEKTINNFEEVLNSYRKEIKGVITGIFNKKIKIKEAEDKYETIIEENEKMD